MYDDPIYDAIYLARNGYAGGGSTLLDKLGQTWPARLAQSTWDAIKTPHDVYTGKLPMYTADENGEVSLNPDVIQRTTDIAGLAALGGTGAYPVAKSAGYAPDALQFGTAGGGYSKAIPKHLQEGIDVITPNNPRGLPMDYESRMLRAKEMGFDVDTPVYHGTDRTFESFDPEQAGAATKSLSAKLGTWFSDDIKTAEGYANLAQGRPVQELIDKSYAAERIGNYDLANKLMLEAERLEQKGGNGAHVGQYYLRGNFDHINMNGATYDPVDTPLSELIKKSRSDGNEGLKLHNFSDEADYAAYNPTTHSVVYNPSQIRSVHAAFDPQRKDSSNLMASLAALIGSGALADYYNQEK